MARPRQRPAVAFQQKVERVVKSIPRGQVLSYAQVALRAGKPGAARAVVRALHWISGAPWWRVIRSDGTLAAQVASQQKSRLQRDGVLVRGRRVIPRALPRSARASISGRAATKGP